MNLDALKTILSLEKMDEKVRKCGGSIKSYWFTFRNIDRKDNKPKELENELGYLRLRLQMDLYTYIDSHHFEAPDANWYKDEFNYLKSEWPEFTRGVIR